MTDNAQRSPASVLAACHRVVIVDYPSRDVPDALVRAGHQVMVKGGPGRDDFREQVLRDGAVVAGTATARPTGADLVYAHRPLSELAGIVDLARELGARAVWRQSGLSPDGERDPVGCWAPEEECRQARQVVESAGLVYIDDTYIADVARLVSGGD